MTDTDFAWGTTSSSVQVQGVHPAADWSQWERDDLAPRSGDGNGFTTNFHDDLALIASLGVTDVRLTLEWARIEPVEGKVDRDELDRYHDIVSHAVAVGLRPWLTLHHTTSPGWFSDDTNAWREESSRSYLWLRHVDRCAERFGDLATGWTPIEDPIGWAVRGYLLGSRPPGRRASSDVAMADFLEHAEAALLADHLAARHLRAGGARTMASRGTPTIFSVLDDPQSALEADAADKHVRWWASLLFDSWVGAAANGELVIPGRSPLQDAQWIDDFDVLGIGFDHPIGVDARGGLRRYPADGVATDVGFVPLPEELGVQLRRLSDWLPDHDLCVSSSSIATTDDDRRTEVLGQTVEIVESAVADGIKLAGFFWDTAIDGYEWRAGFDTHCGLIARDRTVKPSGELYGETCGS